MPSRIRSTLEQIDRRGPELSGSPGRLGTGRVNLRASRPVLRSVSIDAQANADRPVITAFDRQELPLRAVVVDFDTFFTAEYAPLVTLLTAVTGSRPSAEEGARRRTERLMLVRLAGQRPGPPPSVSSSCEDQEFWAVVRSLPRRQAAAVALHYLEDRPVAEVATILGCAEGTAKAHLHKGRANLARLLESSETPHGS